MTKSKLPSLLAVTALIGSLSTVGIAGLVNSAYAQSQGAAMAPDNSGANVENRGTNGMTADNAGNQMPDRDIMQKIRQAVVADKSLSTYGHNVKIIAQSGKVTLKGPVKTDDEKQNIEAKATSIAGAGNVTDDLTVKNGQPN